MGISRYFALSAYWFGFSFHWFLLLPLLMPADVEHFVGAANKGTYLGILAGGMALIPLILPPFLGAWSDRLGKRKPFFIWGTSINVLGLLVMLLATHYWFYAFGYVLVQLGNSLASSPYSALIPDTVPESERGTASGALAFFQLLSQIAGGLAAFALGGNRTGQYLAIILVLVVCTIITLFKVREPTQSETTTKRKNATPTDPKVFFGPNYQDFRWVFITRALMESGRFAVQPFLLYYLRDVIGHFSLGNIKIPNAGLALTALLMLLSLTATITAIVSGPQSDRLGKKPIIYLAGASMAVAALGFAFVHNYPLVILMGLFFGLGYGAFVSVDWALATSVLPHPEHNARDMGVWHIALVFPQIFQSVFGFVLDTGNKLQANSGYSLLFMLAVVFFGLGTVFVSRIKNTR